MVPRHELPRRRAPDVLAKAEKNGGCINVISVWEGIHGEVKRLHPTDRTRCPARSPRHEVPGVLEDLGDDFEVLRSRRFLVRLASSLSGRTRRASSSGQGAHNRLRKLLYRDPPIVSSGFCENDFFNRIQWFGCQLRFCGKARTISWKRERTLEDCNAGGG